MIEAPAQQRENQWVSSEWAGPPCAAAAHMRTSSRLTARDPNGLGIVPVGQVSATVSYKTRSTQTKRGAARPGADQHRLGGWVGGKCNLRLTNNHRLLFIRKPNTLIGTSQYKKKNPWQLKYSKVQTDPFVLLRELGDCITCVCSGLCLHRVALQG